MRAVLQHRPGGAEELYIGTAGKPAPGADELLVRVAFSALNRADILQREGKYPPPPGASPVPGLEFAGVVEAKGDQVEGWSTGDRVFGLVPGGGHAEFAVIHKDMAIRIPEGMSFAQCAAIPEVFLTAFQSLVWLADARAGEKVLVHAGGSGVGTAAIQLARFLGAEAIATASVSKLAFCRDLGASAAIDYKQPGFWQELQDLTGGVDVIIDPVGGSYFSGNLKLLKNDGRLVMLAVMGGSRAADVNIGQIVFKRLKITGSTLRSRPQEYQVALVRDFWERVGDQFVIGNIVPVIDTIFDWNEIAEAHRYMEANRNTGKVLLKIA